MAKTPVTFTISLLQLCFAVGVQIMVVAISIGGLFSRVEAMEAAVQPIQRGDFARLDERVQHIQGDIAWIRAQLEKERDR
nr:hypothetical protein [Brevundimonas diminuta]